MTRKEEIIILLQHLREDVIKTAKNYPSLLSKKIVENGKLIEKYELEFDEAGILVGIEETEELRDEFAIEFAEWVIKGKINKQLLEMFKKEKGYE